MRRNGIIVVIMLVSILSGIMTVSGYEDTCLPEKFTSEIIFDPQNHGKHPPFFLPGEQVQVKIEFSRPPKGCEDFDVVLKSDSSFVTFQNPIKKSRSLEMTMIISWDPEIRKRANPNIIAMLVHGSRSIILEKNIIIGEKTQIEDIVVVLDRLPVSFKSFYVIVSETSSIKTISSCLLILTNETGVLVDKKESKADYGKVMSKISLKPKEAGIYTVTVNCQNFAGATKVAQNIFLVNLSETEKDKPYIITTNALSSFEGDSFTVDFSRTPSFERELQAKISDIKSGKAVSFGQCGSSQCKITLYGSGWHFLKFDLQYKFPNFKYSGTSTATISVFVSQNQSGKPQLLSAQQIQSATSYPVPTPTPAVTATADLLTTEIDCIPELGCKTSPGIGGFSLILPLVILALRKRK